MPLNTALSPQIAHEIAQLHQQLQASAGSVHVTGAAVAITAGGLGVAYVTLAVRAGVITAAVLPGIPMWAALDPASLLKAPSTLTKLKFLLGR